MNYRYSYDKYTFNNKLKYEDETMAQIIPAIKLLCYFLETQLQGNIYT